MKFRPARLGSSQSLVALSVSVAIVLSSHAFAFASLAPAGGNSPATKIATSQNQTDSSPSELRIISATATATADGILLQWSANSATDNLGFNVYRLRGGQRTRVNREIIPGAVFAGGAELRSGYSHSWFDRGGTADSTYYIESVSLQGVAKTHESLSPVTSKAVSGFARTSGASSGGSANAAESTDSFEKYYPAAETQINSPQGAIEDQWAIAAQPALKIAIKKDGWYRVTQPQMVATGFNPTVDIRNLRLFVDAQEVGINTSQHSGAFGSSDYIEFYGRGLDKPTADTRIYYLLAGTTRGKRVRGQIQLDGDPIVPPAPTSTPPPSAGSSPPASPSSPPSTPGPLLQDPIFFSWVQRDLNVWTESLRAGSAPLTGEAKEKDNAAGAYIQLDPGYDAPPDKTPPFRGGQRPPVQRVTRSLPLPMLTRERITNAAGSDKTPPFRGRQRPPAQRVTRSLPLRALTTGSGKFRNGSVSKKRNKLRREPRQERNHAVFSAAAAAAGSAPPNFAYTAERKDRTVYFTKVLNGDVENWFGQVITFNATNPASQTINTPNPDLSAAGNAQLEIALQGVNQVQHQVSVEFNGVVVGSFSFFGFDPGFGGHPVQVFNIPVSRLNNGANTIRFILPSGGDVSIVDYVKLTYPHLFRADTGALKFTLRGTQSTSVDGLSTPAVRLIDYTDPLNVGISRLASAPSGSGFAITVPPSDPPSKAPRLLYAIAAGQFDQPAALTLNQPSSLNQGAISPMTTSGADFLIVAHKDIIGNLAPLLSQRQGQGKTAAAVDVEDVYDEFSYGVHGPQAIKDFLLQAATRWATKPRYVILAGDASLDPRNYMNIGNFDLVPTKLLDATFNETASDDWLTDFDNDAIADIPVGRLPVRTVAEADLVISKIVNFSPANVPSNALLVADQDDQFHSFGFVEANDAIQTQLIPASMAVQRVNRGTSGLSDSQARADIIAGLNAGRAVVNYSGHGNVDVWTSSSIFTATDARSLTNGNKLSFVVVMDCLNGYFHDPNLESMSEGFLKAPAGGAVAAFASSGLTFAQGQHVMSQELYRQLYGNPQSIPLGDAIKIAKAATFDDDVKRTWIFFGDPSMKIR